MIVETAGVGGDDGHVDWLRFGMVSGLGVVDGNSLVRKGSSRCVKEGRLPPYSVGILLRSRID